jgi:hypothetical protein
MSTQTETASTPHVDVDEQVLGENFAKHDIPLRHNLASNPLFELDAIADLADRMPEGQVEHNLGNLPEELPDGAPPQADLSPGEIARGIETNGCWLVLKRIEFDPRYKALLESLLGPIAQRMGPREGGATKLEAYIVLSAPNSTTPVHIDPEHNFFMHIRGPKRFDVGSWDNEEAKLTAMKRYYGEEHRREQTATTSSPETVCICRPTRRTWSRPSIRWQSPSRARCTRRDWRISSASIG